MDTHGIARMRLDDRGRRIFRLVDDARLEQLAKGTAVALPEFIRLRPVVHRSETGGILHIGHEARPDDVVFVLEEQGHIAIVHPVFVSRYRSINNDVGRPTVLAGNVRAGLRIPVRRPLGADHQGSVESAARIGHHIAPVPHQ